MFHRREAWRSIQDCATTLSRKVPI
jgi:hypothetical protein